VGTTIGHDIIEKKISYPCQESKLDSSVVQKHVGIRPIPLHRSANISLRFLHPVIFFLGLELRQIHCNYFEDHHEIVPIPRYRSVLIQLHLAFAFCIYSCLRGFSVYSARPA
jgi:hypothetical protein